MFYHPSAVKFDSHGLHLEEVSDLVFYAQSTSTVVSGQFWRTRGEKLGKQSCDFCGGTCSSLDSESLFLFLLFLKFLISSVLGCLLSLNENTCVNFSSPDTGIGSCTLFPFAADVFSDQWLLWWGGGGGGLGLREWEARGCENMCVCV